ncbi:hypothetical protein [Nocardia tengchongensis]|uniref:hypothetical protein n=1 Tax=Nocardia tengchongensis TaxID=2055889 RepID=UPI0036A0AE43
MSTAHRRARKIAWSAAVVSVAGALSSLYPALAAAGIHGIEVQECTTTTCTTPASYVVGQSYVFFAGTDGVSASAPTSSFYDNGTCIGGGGYNVTWVPLTAGNHTLSTNTQGHTESLTVVVVAAPPGSPTAQQPQQGTCGGGFGSGSSNLLPGS